MDLANETAGAEPKALVPVVGIWRIENEGGKKVLAVDGRQWKEGQSSAGIADKARALYGERYAEFLDRVQAYAYYPYVVAKDVEDFKNGEITVRFEGLSGRIDQGAGILFNLKPNGDYLTIRANCLENNLVLWKFEKGRRSQVKWIRNTPTASRQWHDLKVRIAGDKVEGYLDGKLYLRAHAARAGVRQASGCGRRPTATCIRANSSRRARRDEGSRRRDINVRLAIDCRCRYAIGPTRRATGLALRR